VPELSNATHDTTYLFSLQLLELAGTGAEFIPEPETAQAYHAGKIFPDNIFHVSTSHERC
jgi:hypothetical protein